MNKKLLVAIGVAMALAVQIALALFFWTRDDAPAEVTEANAAAAGNTEQKALYHNLRPPFVVTLPYGNRQFMLQADLAVTAHEQAAIEAIIRHGPLIRAEIITYLTDLDPEQVRSKNGKQELLDGLTALINRALRTESEEAAVDAVLFNNLVMQ